MLTRDDLIGFRPATRDVPVPGGTVRVREISAGDRDFIQFDVVRNRPLQFRAALVALSACEPSGVPMFDARDDKHLAIVAGLPTSLVEPIVEAALDLNGMAEEEKEAAGKGSESPLLNG